MADQRLDKRIVRHPAWTRTAPVVESTLDRVRPYTMVARPSLENLAEQVRALLAMEVPGDFVECGVWRGGASFLMAELLNRSRETERKVWMFDSFEGLPPPEAVDGSAANHWATDVSAPGYHDNCSASLEGVLAGAAELGVARYAQPVKGWFDQTLPATRDRIQRIALLRIDADWHASVLCCLENLFDRVVEGGLVVFDDYYTWSGCAVAAHEFFGARKLGYPIEAPLGSGCGMPAVVRKSERTWDSLRRQLATFDEVRRRRQELTAIIPRGSSVICVGQDAFDDDGPPSEWAVNPFLEKDGEYWGLPADDGTAIREFERLRAAGAQFIVLAASAFWWLDHYADFAHHLYDNGRRVLRTERSVVYDLRAAGATKGR